MNQKQKRAFVMFRLLRKNTDADLISSALYDQNTFYQAFIWDLNSCQKEVIIESPFITTKRVDILLPIFAKLRQRNVRIVINTRNLDDHDDIYRIQALDAVANMQTLGIKVLYTVGHHRKLAIIDKQTIWEGSLNILSFNGSCEIMRKITSVVMAKQLLSFTGLKKYLR
jgi:phosphatidylserine/phosphatidylglycerophosphate/cardiolipin synthase-like enzyme